MFICNLHCQLFYVFPVICYIKTRPDAKFSIVPEEGWFGQPKYGTRSKKHSTLCRFLPLYSSQKIRLLFAHEQFDKSRSQSS